MWAALGLFACESPAVKCARRLFFRADSRVSDRSRSWSCATCHAEGRTDGLKWSFGDGMRQTPSLAGGIADTAPFTRRGTMPTVGAEAAVVAERLGGAGLDGEDIAAIEAAVQAIRAPQPSSRLDPDAVSRGAVLFEGFGCLTCHTAPTGADRLLHRVSDRFVATP